MLQHLLKEMLSWDEAAIMPRSAPHLSILISFQQNHIRMWIFYAYPLNESKDLLKKWYDIHASSTHCFQHVKNPQIKKVEKKKIYIYMLRVSLVCVEFILRNGMDSYGVSIKSLKLRCFIELCFMCSRDMAPCENNCLHEIISPKTVCT